MVARGTGRVPSVAYAGALGNRDRRASRNLTPRTVDARLYEYSARIFSS